MTKKIYADTLNVMENLFVDACVNNEIEIFCVFFFLLSKNEKLKPKIN